MGLFLPLHYRLQQLFLPLHYRLQQLFLPLHYRLQQLFLWKMPGKRIGNYNPWNKKYDTDEERLQAKRDRDNARNARKRNSVNETPVNITPNLTFHNETFDLKPKPAELNWESQPIFQTKGSKNKLDIAPVLGKGALRPSPAVTASAPDMRDVTLTINKGDTINTTDTDGVVYRDNYGYDPLSPFNNSSGKTYRFSYDTVHNLGTFSKEPARSIEPYDYHPTPKVEDIGWNVYNAPEEPINVNEIPKVDTQAKASVKRQEKRCLFLNVQSRWRKRKRRKTSR